mmetsp:Transcript_4214/g.13451  ORF Transcript_4214/g.13451 Transcript_4214/m.13451 type:complete len:290 (+) Transcript_4214:278-1147(+)
MHDDAARRRHHDLRRRVRVALDERGEPVFPRRQPDAARFAAAGTLRAARHVPTDGELRPAVRRRPRSGVRKGQCDAVGGRACHRLRRDVPSAVPPARCASDPGVLRWARDGDAALRDRERRLRPLVHVHRRLCGGGPRRLRAVFPFQPRVARRVRRVDRRGPGVRGRVPSVPAGRGGGPRVVFLRGGRARPRLRVPRDHLAAADARHLLHDARGGVPRDGAHAADRPAGQRRPLHVAVGAPAPLRLRGARSDLRGELRPVRDGARDGAAARRRPRRTDGRGRQGGAASG